MFTSPFTNEAQVSIPDDADIIFVSDLFSSDHTGGAELTTDAIIDSSPYTVFRLHAKNVSEKLLSQGVNRYWIFGNFTSMNPALIPTIIANLKYSIVEYDYKYCKYRSTAKHEKIEGKSCNCHNEMNGKMISAFFYGARSLWWMSDAQMEKYHAIFPFLSQVKNSVLSSVFNEEFFHFIAELSKESEGLKRDKWIVVRSTSWIKGTESAVEHCKSENLDYEIVEGLDYSHLLRKLSTSKGLVFLPLGLDTCPRLVIEAKLLGCDLVINQNVQNSAEEWFSSPSIKDTLTYLYSARERFWRGIKNDIEYLPTLSGYTTTYDCIRQKYPYESSILSMLDFCDQVVIVDGGSTDGTWEKLKSMAEENEKIVIHQQKRDWSHPRFAVFDGLQKALARALCTSEFCWQQDSDEVVHESDYDKIKALSGQLPANVDLVALPVVEFWGDGGKVRIDVNPWKWRLSRNRPHITHGIPAHLRKFDESGNLYSLPGTDGCDYVRSDSFEPIPFANFYTEESHALRINALQSDKKSLQKYQEWIEAVTSQLPGVYHYSWIDIGRKIRTYRDYWSGHWQSLYDVKQEDIPENNMFFNKKWENVSEREIDRLAKKLQKDMGGWIFHTKIDFSKKTPHIELERSHPSRIVEKMGE